MNDHIRDLQPVKPTFVRKDQRGDFIEIVNEGPWETIIHGTMEAGSEMGNHYHREARAYFYIVSGKAEIRMRHLFDDTVQKTVLHAGEGVYFLPYEIHVVHYLEKSDFIFLKSYRYTDDQPDIFPGDV
jgi:quercetin dioxygenase-like cupin family protein